MPIYTYRCANCGAELNHQQRFSAPPLSHCPKCREDELHRVYKPVGIVFKGSGFYATDNRSPTRANGKASSNKSTESKKTSSESSSKTSEVKTAEKV
ncbi:MAG: FmdB family zinc ribbon protein [Anaerolineales bacterium]